MNISSENIWSFDDASHTLTPRSRAINLSPDHGLIHLDDITHTISVDDGLQPEDVAVFLTFYGPEEQSQDPADAKPHGDTIKTRTEGYLVSMVEPDGSGILVRGDVVNEMPSDYMTDELLRKLVRIELSDIEFFEEFGLHALGTHVRKRIKTNR
jgi:hypothetical protein